MHRLEKKITELTRQVTDLQDRQERILRSKGMLEMERNRAILKYEKLRQTIFPTIELEQEYAAAPGHLTRTGVKNRLILFYL